MEGCSICDHGTEVNCTDNGESIKIINGCCFDDVKCGDDDEKLRALFEQVLMVLLRGIRAKNGCRPIPALLGDGQPVDLFKLFCLVRDRGGYHSVCEGKLWGLIAEKFRFDCSSCASLKLIYYKYLDELDQWLNRITRDRNSENGRNEYGGSFTLLSLELEKRLRNFSIEENEITNDDSIGSDKICSRVDVSNKENLDAKEASEAHNVVVKFSVEEEDGLCNSKKLAAKEMVSVSVEDSPLRKRKRDMIGGMLSWMIKVAKNPCHQSIGIMPRCSRWKENNLKDFWSIALFVREARLQKRNIEPNDQQSNSHQRKQKMHPSMYEDLSNHHSVERLRCSGRRVSLENTPCQCCKSSSADNNIINNPPCYKLEDVNADISDTKLVVLSSLDLPIEKQVLVGPKFQAEVPIWTGIVSESDPKWLGTQTWAPDLKEKNSCGEIELWRKERPESCKCQLRGSVECHRFHIAESRMKLRRELGLAFFRWKFDSMGEEVSLSWSAEEEKRFKQIVRMDKPSLGKSYFPRRTWKDLVSYYFNVHLINRRSYQNRVTPKDINSDDDEVEFGSVSEAFGYSAVKIQRSEPLICVLNEQDMDFDYVLG